MFDSILSLISIINVLAIIALSLIPKKETSGSVGLARRRAD